MGGFLYVSQFHGQADSICDSAGTAAIVYELWLRVAVDIKEALKRSRISITRGSGYESTEAPR